MALVNVATSIARRMVLQTSHHRLCQLGRINACTAAQQSAAGPPARCGVISIAQAVEAVNMIVVSLNNSICTRLNLSLCSAA